MIESARKNGINLIPTDGFRDYQQQSRAYGGDSYCSEHGYNNFLKVAAPGHSQHQLGTAVDFGKDPRQYRWLEQNAGEYGFSLSYPRADINKTGIIFEPWHYRYITEQGVQMQDTFFSGSQHDMLVFLQGCLSR